MILLFDIFVVGVFWPSLFFALPWLVTALVVGLIRKSGVLNVLLWIALPIVVVPVGFGAMVTQKKIADARAQAVVDACERFRYDHGHYPQTLGELAPRYLESVPRARYTLMWGQFLYARDGDGAVLGWYAVPPSDVRRVRLRER